MSNLDNIQFVDQAQLKQVMLANADKADKRYIKKSELDVSEVVKQDMLGELASKDEVGSEDLSASLAAEIAAKIDATDVYTSAQADEAIAAAIDNLGDLASLDKVSADDLTDAVKNRIEDTYTKAEVYTKEDVYTKDEVDTAVRNQVASVYKPAGSATIETLPEPTAANLGYVFNITETGYSTEAFVEGAGQKISAGTNVVVVLQSEDNYKYDIFAGELDLTGYVKEDDITVATSEQIQDIIDSIYRGQDSDIRPEVVEIVPESTTSFAEISRAFDDPEVTTVNARLAEGINVPKRDDGKITTTFINDGQTVNLDLNGQEVSCEAYAMFVQPGGTLNLTGEGTIKTRILDKTYPAIQNNGGTVNIGPDVVVDTTTAEAEAGSHNWTYGLVASGDGIFNVKGTIITDEASCLAVTNGTTENEGTQFIVSGNAVLRTLASSAIYLADNKSIVIKDNSRVDGGIIARMGEITLQDNAVATHDLEWFDDRGEFYASSGTAAVRENIMLLAGCYKAGTGTNDMILTIKDNAKVSSANGEAITVNRLDTLYDQKVIVNVENSENLTAADGYDKIHVYEYDDIKAEVEASGKTMKPKTVESDVTITVDGVVTYDSIPDEPTPEPEPEEP